MTTCFLPDENKAKASEKAPRRASQATLPAASTDLSTAIVDKREKSVVIATYQKLLDTRAASTRNLASAGRHHAVARRGGAPGYTGPPSRSPCRPFFASPCPCRYLPFSTTCRPTRASLAWAAGCWCRSGAA